MLAREVIFKEIADAISVLTLSTQNRGLQGLFDQHIIAEHFFAGLLNRAFGWHLVRTQLLRKNQAAIDLFDSDNHLVFQVTSNPKRAKIEHTIDLFIRKAADFASCRLKFLIMGKKQKYRKPFRQSNRIGFSPEEDLWDTENPLSRLDALDTSALRKVRDFISQEMQLGQTRNLPGLREERRVIYETFKNFISDFDRASAQTKGEVISSFIDQTDQLSFLGMPEVDDLRTAMISRASNLLRIEDRFKGRDPRLRDKTFRSRNEQEEQEILNWFDQLRKKFKEMFLPYCSV